MGILARSLIAFILCSSGVIALQSGDYAQALNRAALFGARTPPPDNLNLGDCLRPHAAARWPQAYRAICTDLAAAITSDGDGAANAARGSSDPLATAAIITGSIARQESGKPRPLALRPSSAGALADSAEALADSAEDNRPACLVTPSGITTRRHDPHPGDTTRKPAILSAGQTRTGMALSVDADCLVAAPVSGRVMYAGDFKGYRGTVILRLANGHQLIIAGFDRIDVARGQSLSKGAYLGMTSKEPAPALANAYRNSIEKPDAVSRTLLYYDMRNAKGDSQKLDWLTKTG